MSLQDNREAVARLRDHILPLMTPFDEAAEVDLEAAAYNVERTLRLPGCGGVYLGSVYQEFWSLTVTERLQLAATTVAQVNGRVPVVVGVSSTSLKTTLELAERAQAAGADMLMVWPPIFGPRDAMGVYRFYKAVATLVPMPTCIYSTQLPELGFYLGDDLLAELADLPPICVVKEASFDITTYLHRLDRLGSKLAISTPFDEYWMVGRMTLPYKTPEFLMGSSRPLYMQTTEHPHFGTLLQLIRDGEMESAYGVLSTLSDMIQDLQMDSFHGGQHPVAMVKYAATRLGMHGTAYVRPPTPELTASRRQVVEEVLTRHGFISSAVADSMAATVE